jgi:hypothetical protein
MAVTKIDPQEIPDRWPASEETIANLQQRQRLVATQEVAIAQEDILRFQTEVTSLHERTRAREAELAAWRRELERLS